MPARPAPEPPARVYRPAPPPEPIAVTDWRAFRHVGRALARRIDGASLAVGRGQGKPAVLASLRLVDEAAGLVAAGELARGLDLLERALAVDGRNGFAYLYLCVAHHRAGRSQRAAGFLDPARRYLPPNPYVLGEWEGLRAAVVAAQVAGSGADG